LVVDDDRADLHVIDMMLRRLSLETTLATNGYDALERAVTETWDVVFMDLRMPGIDGLKTTRRIRRRLSSRPLRRSLSPSTPWKESAPNASLPAWTILSPSPCSAKNGATASNAGSCLR
jgi:CheY-like chemotaxis protein